MLLIDKAVASSVALAAAAGTAAVAMDWTPVFVAGFAAIPPSLIAYLGYRTSQAAVTAALLAADRASKAEKQASDAHAVAVATGITVDGVKTELIEAVRGRAEAEGLAAGREEGKATEKVQAAEVAAALEMTPGFVAALTNDKVVTPPIPVVIVGQDQPVPVVDRTPTQ